MECLYLDTTNLQSEKPCLHVCKGEGEKKKKLKSVVQL